MIFTRVELEKMCPNVLFQFGIGFATSGSVLQGRNDSYERADSVRMATHHLHPTGGVFEALVCGTTFPSGKGNEEGYRTRRL